MKNLVTISGCSGGGKSTLLAELQRRGHAVVAEPGRRIVAQELEANGRALPWVDPAAFARRAVDTALADLAAVRETSSWVFFDRGLIDAAAALEHVTGEPAVMELGARYRFHRRIFFAPPWPEIYVPDPERRHGFTDAVAEYERLRHAYENLGYELCLLPITSPQERADFVVAALADGLGN